MADRAKVIKDLKDYRDRNIIREGITVFDNDPRYRKMLINDVLALLEEQPQIVRCKDCKHYDGDENCRLGTCLENGVCSTPDWFCADGIAKDTDVLNK